jgi:hypothetical protein
MNKDFQNEMRCSQFEALLADALDRESDRERASAEAAAIPEMPVEVRKAFDAHRASCPSCAPLYAEAREGMLLLRAMDEVEPPRHLMHNILAATSGVEVEKAAPARVHKQPGWVDRLRQGLRPTMGGLMHSRFVTSFCMAFFSISLTLSLTGVKLGAIDWRPTALRRFVVLEYTQIQAKVVRYYDNMRLVYEFQSGMQRLKQVSVPSQPQDNNQPQQQNQKHEPGSGRPEPEENYSQERDGSLVAQSMMKHEGARL